MMILDLKNIKKRYNEYIIDKLHYKELILNLKLVIHLYLWKKNVRLFYNLYS